MPSYSGITYDAGNDRITVNFVNGDTRGFDFNDPYTFYNIWETDQANGWNVFKKYGNVYISDATIQTGGVDTYFQDNNFTLIFQGNVSDYYTMWLAANTSIKNFQIIDYISKQFRVYSSNFTCRRGTFCGFSKIVLHGNGIYNYITFNDCNQLVTYSGITEFSEITMVKTSLQSRGAASIMKNVNIYSISDKAIIAGWGNAENLKNVNIVDNSGVDYSLTIRDYVTSFINSQIDIDNYSTRYYSDTFADFILKSTFTVNISSGDSGTATLYDQFGSQVAQQTLSGEWALADPVVYAKRRLESNDGATVTLDTKTVYEPFKLVVTKNGYDTLTIPNITVTAGGETNVYGEMVQVEVQGENLQHTITEDKLKHTITEDKLEHIITD